MERIIQKSEREGRRDHVRKQKDDWSRGSACEMGVQRSGNGAPLIASNTKRQAQRSQKRVTSYKQGRIKYTKIAKNSIC